MKIVETRFLLPGILFILLLPAFSLAAWKLPAEVKGVIPKSQIQGRVVLQRMERGSWSYYNNKLDSRLNLKLDRVLRKGVSNGIRQVGEPGLQALHDKICVQILSSGSGGRNELAKKIDSLGGDLTGWNQRGTVCQALLPLGVLDELSSSSLVAYISSPEPVVPFVGDYTTEAITDINAQSWHDAGVLGQGIKIGVVDIGFLNYRSLLGLELPASVEARNFVDGENDDQIDSGSSHGTACCEVVHDLAPDASLFLAKISTNIDLEEAVAWLKNTCQVDIITTSLGWYNLTPGDGTGMLADLVQEARNAGILWTTAAGNDRLRHWGGLFNDPDGDRIHDFSEELNINYFGDDSGAYQIESGHTYTIYMRWSDWESVVDQDYDIYVYRWTDGSWEVISSSINLQDGTAGQTPTEAAQFSTTGDSTAYGFIIYNSAASENVNFEVFVPNAPRLTVMDARRSLANLADSPAAVTVGAIDVGDLLEESYSAEGPTNGPGGSLTGGYDKPDLASYANVSSASYGPGGFSGTSAATPHVAGAAALILVEHPDYSPDQLRSALLSQAIDVGAAGFDYRTGWGRLHLDTYVDDNPPDDNPPDDNPPDELADLTWLGNSPYWDNSGNWDVSRVPGQSDVVLIPAYPSGGYYPRVTDPSEAGQLILSGQLTISSGSLLLDK
ncbi:MAG: S8 family serine peptidase [Deltaproteobacteria bacterium]|nr:S8 family serine peptidase [Deltaproteobacteria bacterium]